MMKSAILISVILLAGAVPIAPLDTVEPTTAEQTLHIPKADSVVAQFSYLELKHGAEGFDLTVSEKTAIFVDLGFPGNLHVRIGF